MKQIFKLVLSFFCFLGITFSSAAAEAGMISEKQEIEMGKAAAEQIEAQYGVISDPQIVERVERIGQSLVAVCGRKNLTYTFKVLNTEDVNALACPGGHIYVFKGLLDYMPSDAELAGVLGHEIGHVVKRHTVHQIEKNMWTQLVTILAGIASGNGDVLVMGMVVSDALAAGYSRADESAADREGFSYTVKAGYSPYGMLITMHKLQELAEQYGNPGWGVFDSHPDPEQRIRNMNKLLAPLKISPSPTKLADGSACVRDYFQGGNWELVIRETAGGNDPFYRAELLAGALYQIRQKGNIDPTHFIVFEMNDKADIYYEDMQLFTVYRQDAAAFKSAGECAGNYVEQLQDWAEKVNNNEGVAK
ncbi:MAG: M48 family metalloprotease [Acidaminococcaceae bacterium]|nr:M48 family metalloprotease [Acidaminococcaceae bacterium]